ncbi:MAG: hypothetical protein A2020_10190 [Lentisphaerae bacterium GWF2_45_14]|nr:MAG: hypothetical protein A2020_10190 [Lentisphaerae bacterium GWF2_45_14]
MKSSEFIALFEKGKKRFQIVGDEKNGVLIGLDLEGRLFTIIDGEVVNRVNPEAILKQTNRSGYLNPGGDGLWPAPEGTTLGYEYTTGAWRVPAALTGARYIVTESKDNFLRVEAEVDLINNSGFGIPVIFERGVTISGDKNSFNVKVKESIQYIGKETLTKDRCMLAPWTLCQFISGPNSEVVFPLPAASEIWDLYGASDEKRRVTNGLCHSKTDGGFRYQIALGSGVDWLEYRNTDTGLIVKRTAGKLPEGLNYIDIVDAPPTETPSDKGIRFSAYSDPSFFMEIEACGGAPEIYTHGCVMSVEVETVYSSDK